MWPLLSTTTSLGGVAREDLPLGVKAFAWPLRREGADRANDLFEHGRHYRRSDDIDEQAVACWIGFVEGLMQ
jgi:hypothetical protein